MKFLIVDDSRLVRMKLKAELCDRGHSVIEARDGEEAFGRIDADAPDAVFLDLILPKLDGISVLRRLHASRPQPSPFFAMTTCVHSCSLDGSRRPPTCR